MEEKVTVLAKRKTTALLFDYCMDQKIIYTVSPRPMIADEFEVDLQIGNIKQAIALGMFLKENRYEVFGLGEFSKVKVNGKKADNKEEAKAEEAAPLLNF